MTKLQGKSGNTVTVASRLPMDIELQLQEPVTRDVEVNGFVKKETTYFKVGPVVVIHGTAYPVGTPPDGFPERPAMATGAALTPGVDRDFWEKWLEQNKLAEFVRNGHVFAATTTESVRAKAREHRDVVSGFEPLSRDGSDPRMPRKVGAQKKGASTVELAEAD